MLAAALTFVSPLGAVAALVALVPLAALAFAALRTERAAQALHLTPGRRSALILPALLAVAASVCAGLAAAQPALRSPERVAVRTRSEILYVIDVSRSMAAAPNARSATRLARARAVVRQIHAATSDVPSGLAGMTDRVLPYVFPTPDGGVFAAALRTSVRIEAPPPQEVSRTATTFDSLTSLAGDGYFDRTATRRTCVLVTDGESRSFSPANDAAALRAARCQLVVVRVGSTGERVFGTDGVPEAGYTPDPAAASKVESLAQAAGGQAFGPGETASAARAVRALAEAGPVEHRTLRTTSHPLAPWLALAAIVLTLALILVRLLTLSLRDAKVSAYNHSVAPGETASS